MWMNQLEDVAPAAAKRFWAYSMHILHTLAASTIIPPTAPDMESGKVDPRLNVGANGLIHAIFSSVNS